jgi:ornithine cyclodeaminase/alanine dehydrogenase-like protein (mu-crystallin family)
MRRVKLWLQILIVLCAVSFVAERLHAKLIIGVSSVNVAARPLAIIDEYYQSLLRTGVTGAVALSVLGKKESKILGIIGAGQIARHLLESVLRFFSLREIRIWSRSKVTLESFTREMGSLLQIELNPVDSTEMAVKEADLVATMTDADCALVSRGWLSAGATLCSMGNNQELDPGIFYEVDKLIVDDFDFCTTVGDIHAWISRGYLKESEILERLHATIPEVIAGRKPGRASHDEKILAVVQGMASCDLAIARLLYDKLRSSKEVKRIAI